MLACMNDVNAYPVALFSKLEFPYQLPSRIGQLIMGLARENPKHCECIAEKGIITRGFDRLTYVIYRLIARINVNLWWMTKCSNAHLEETVGSVYDVLRRLVKPALSLTLF